MKHLGFALVLVLSGMMALLRPSFTQAAGMPSGRASCVATLSVAETQIAPGFVGAEVSSFATTGPGVVGEFNRFESKNHAGNLEGCIVG